jgi:hypothetical protein
MLFPGREVEMIRQEVAWDAFQKSLVATWQGSWFLDGVCTGNQIFNNGGSAEN